ncbi:hypothetical protein PS627_04514 [Pseudomonas fluorescens]|nr:hypothetical protein PS627_04514 [Pseudomonas fluorescens]
MALVDIVRHDDADAARARADRDGDALAIGQGHHDRTHRYRCGYCSGVDDGTALGNVRRGRQGNGRGVEGIGYLSHRRRAVDRQVLEVATTGAGDMRAHRGCVEIDIIGWRRDAHACRRLARRDGNELASGEDHIDSSTGRIGQRRRVHDAAAFGDGWRRAETDSGGVLSIRHRGPDRVRAGHQIFVAASTHRSDAVADRGMPLVHVVGHTGADRARTRADRNGDALAIGERDHDRCPGDRRRHARGVQDRTPFRDAGRGGQADGRPVCYIGDAGIHGCRIGDQVLVVATADAGDAVGDGRMAFIDVIGDQSVDCAGALAHCDGDALAVGERYGHRTAGNRRAHRCGVHDDSALGDAWGGSQGNGRSIGHVGDRGADRGRVGGQVFVIAPTCARDAVGDWSVALVDVVWRGVIDRA